MVQHISRDIIIKNRAHNVEVFEVLDFIHLHKTQHKIGQVNFWINDQMHKYHAHQ
jgi:hypothetical protein